MIPWANHNVCIVCRSAASGIAVGNPKQLGWCCDFCGPELAMEAYRMPAKDLSIVEKNALEAVRKMLPDEALTVSSPDIVPFLEWLIQQFGEKIREEVHSGRPPF